MITTKARAESGENIPSLTRGEAEEFIYRECRLLDEVRLEEWLTLFTEDGRYWLPLADGEPEEAERGISLVYDDATRRSERVYRTLHTPVLDQDPRSRTVHLVGNVEVDAPDTHGDMRVLCSQIIAEMRPGGARQVGLSSPRLFAAHCEYRFRSEADGWKISVKKVRLLDCDQPIYNLTFIV